MISRTKEIIEEVDDLLLQIIGKVNELEHELRFQPHAKHMIEELEKEVKRLFKRHQSSFVKPFRKGWIY
jgi:hypothetical protein